MSHKIKIGITGQNGFIGWHLYNRLKLIPDEFECIEFEKDFFLNEKKLEKFVNSCDVIIHLAAVNRSKNEQELYNTNINLVKRLLDACEKTKSTPHFIFSSSTQEKNDNLYGQSKKKGKQLFENWASKNNSKFTSLIIPNVFGEFCRPNYNSVVATFAHKLITDEAPSIITDSDIQFIYVSSLCEKIIHLATEQCLTKVRVLNIEPDFNLKVSELLNLYKYFYSTYIETKHIPELKNKNEINLFNTFRSYIDLEKEYPVILKKHCDERGDFVETLKLHLGGQVSFSTTKPNITRGNHFHTRKIERFTVIKGRAKISLRKIGTDKVYNFVVDAPGYVDMPVWYTHNLTNIGEEDLYTQFWINEFYDPADADTFFEKVE